MELVGGSRDAGSTRPEHESTPTSTTGVSPESSASPSANSGSLTPSRGLKRTRAVDATISIGSSSSISSHDEPPSKRAHESPTTSSRGGSPSGESLRISNELLRSDNDHLQQQLAKAKDENAAMDVQLTQQKQRVRNLEEDLTRMYRRQKREAETRQAAHTQAIDALRQQLDHVTKQLEDRPVVDPTVALLTPETTQEMDAFVAMCSQWQHKLAALSTQLASQVARVEQAEIKAVMDGMVHKVDDAYRLSQVQTAEKAIELQWLVLKQQEQDLQALADRMKAEREDVETFESMERQVLEQRVAELDKTVEEAKQNERVLLQQMADLREELVKMRSGNHIVPQSEWQKKLEDDAHLKDQLETLTVRCEAQNVQLTLLREDLSSLQAENDELAADLTARKQAAAGDDDTASIVTKQLEDRIAELKDQLSEVKKNAREAEAALRAELSTKMQEEAENLNNRIEVLNLNVEAKAKVIETLTADKNDLLARVAKSEQALETMEADTTMLQQQLDTKNHKIETLQYEISELELNLESKLKQVIDEATSEKLELQKQMTTKTCDWVELNRELNEAKRQLESKTQELYNVTQEKVFIESVAAELRQEVDQLRQAQPKIAALEAKNKDLLHERQNQSTKQDRLQEQLVSMEREKQQLQSEVRRIRMQGVSSMAEKSMEISSGTVSLTPEIQARIAKLLVEKRAVENFLQQYYDVAEAKCQDLSEQVIQLEAKHATHRQHARDSCHLLRMCTEIDTCDSTVRASLLDVMTTLESIS